VAIAILGMVEIMVARQKSQMKKQFLEELDRQDREKRDGSTDGKEKTSQP